MVAPSRGWQGTANITNTTAVVVAPAAGVGIQNYLKSFQYQNKHATVATLVQILAGAVVIWQMNAPAVQVTPVQVVFDPPLKSGTNVALSVNNGTTGSDTLFAAQGFIGQ